MRFPVYKFKPDIEKCRQLAEGPGRHVAVVGQPTTLTLYVVDENGKESQHWVNVRCIMEYYEDELWRREEGEGWRVTNSQYVISYTPRNRNEHRIHIRIEGEYLGTVTLNPKG